MHAAEMGIITTKGRSRTLSSCRSSRTVTGCLIYSTVSPQQPLNHMPCNCTAIQSATPSSTATSLLGLYQHCNLSSWPASAPYCLPCMGSPVACGSRLGSMPISLEGNFCGGGLSLCRWSLVHHFLMMVLFITGDMGGVIETFGYDGLRHKLSLLLPSYLASCTAFHKQDLTHILGGVRFFPVDRLTFLSLQSFHHLTQHDFRSLVAGVCCVYALFSAHDPPNGA